MKRILVTGGAGFIGSHLCTKLVGEGNEVICLDNFFTGSEANVRHLTGNPLFSLVCHDIVEPYSVQVDEIYNLACPASPIHYQHNPVKTLKTAVLGAMNMLDLARVTGARILQASTSEVYGDPVVHPQTEDYWGHVNPVGMRSCYDEGKRCAETLFMDYHKQYGIRTKIVRIFNTYGPRMDTDDGRVVSNFIVQAIKNEDVTIYGGGDQTRSFQYVDDLIWGIERVMQTPDDFTGPINIGNCNEYTMIELAREVIRLTGSHSNIVFKPLPPDDPKHRQPDTRLAQKVLGYVPRIELQEGLEKTIRYFREITGQSEQEPLNPDML